MGLEHPVIGGELGHPGQVGSRDTFPFLTRKVTRPLRDGCCGLVLSKRQSLRAAMSSGSGTAGDFRWAWRRRHATLRASCVHLSFVIGGELSHPRMAFALWAKSCVLAILSGILGFACAVECLVEIITVTG